MAIQGPYINQVEGIAIAQNVILPLESGIDNATNKANIADAKAEIAQEDVNNLELSLAPIAKTGSYNDLLNKPIPTFSNQGFII